MPYCHRIPQSYFKDYVAKCAGCQKARLKKDKFFLEQVRTLKADPKPRSAVCIDRVSISPPSRSGNRSAITIAEVGVLQFRTLRKCLDSFTRKNSHILKEPPSPWFMRQNNPIYNNFLYFYRRKYWVLLLHLLMGNAWVIMRKMPFFCNRIVLLLL